jgi:hypothetical protein
LLSVRYSVAVKKLSMSTGSPASSLLRHRGQ